MIRNIIRGKLFHENIQSNWLKNAEGKILIAKGITKLSGRKGRIDIFVDDDGTNFVAVAEVNASDWDKMTDTAVHRNVRRQIKQIWDYINSQLS